jgi:hypothetical protein
VTNEPEKTQTAAKPVTKTERLAEKRSAKSTGDHRGKAKAHPKTRSAGLTDPHGHDVENPT